MVDKRKLLTRDNFSEAVFDRDGGKCVICKAEAADAHHILDRSLFTDGGYYLDNGASVCHDDHYRCETTEISVEEIRTAAGIKAPEIPEHFDVDQEYDKWGNPVLPNGMRQRGELFTRENVQKALAAGGKLDLFSHWVKYPRTYHFPFSASVTDDDKTIRDYSSLEGRRVIGTLKLDGENTTLYNDHIHARSLDGRHHPSRNWVKGFWSGIRSEIPDYWRICGENLFARHSIRYDNLRSYFYGFSVWNEANVALSWDETIEWFQLLGIEPVEVVYDGIFDESELKRIAGNLDTSANEGFVVRVADAIPYHDFRSKVAKWVRPAHVQTDKHWMTGEIEPNGLAEVSLPRY